MPSSPQVDYYSYAHAEYDSNTNTNNYAVSQRESYPYTESDTEVAPGSTVAPTPPPRQ
jgi:hypothetical protein